MNEMLLNDKEIFAIAGYPENYQDSVVLVLFYEQLSGAQIRNLKVVDIENVAKDFNFSQETESIIRNSLEETKYVGETSIYELKATEYVVRGAEDGPVSDKELSKRVRRMLDAAGYRNASIDDVRKCGKDNKELK